MKKKYLTNVIAGVLSILLVFFIWHNFSLNGNSAILVMFIPIFYIFLKRVMEKENKRKFIISTVIAVSFAVIELVGKSINEDYTLAHIWDQWILLNFLGTEVIAWSIVSTIYTFLEENEWKAKTIKILDSKWSFLVYALLILIAWIPYFLTYYPGILTSDSCTQVAQAIGNTALNNHHPILHTGIISLFINLGRNVFGNINTGVAFYSIFQMIAMASMFSIVLVYMNKKNVPWTIRIIALLYYMFYPVNALFSVIMWKDILFAGMIPIYIILTMELMSGTEEFLENIKKVALYILISILVMFLRNNGLYLVVLTLPLVLIFLRKYWKKMLAISCVIVLSYFIVKTVIFSSLQIKEGPVGEMLSVPLQQIARVKKYHKEELDEETTRRINQFFRCEDIEEKYNPVLSDPVKAELNQEYFDENKGEFISLWLHLLKGYFKDYVESFLSNSYGYYYPEARSWVANRTMEENTMGLEQTPIIEGKLVSFVNSAIDGRSVPISSMCFSIGMAFWMIVLSLGYEILKKEYKSIPRYWILFILWLTIVASPVFCEYRYAYGMFTSLPLLIGFNFIKKEK